MGFQISDGGTSGRYSLLLAPQSGRARALVVELHGSGLDVQRQQSLSHLSDIMLRRDVAVLLPQGAIPFQLMPEAAPGFAWSIPGAPLPGETQPVASPHDDLGWIESLVRAVQADLDLVDEPLFLAGYSGGARLASHLLVKAGLQWKAAGLVAGLRAIDDPDHAPPPTLSFHGVDDPVNPYRGSADSRWSIGVEEAGDLYAASQGCLSGHQEEAVPGGRRRIYSTSRRRGMLELYAVSHGAHAWPGSIDPDHLAIFGPAGRGMDASRMIATFFLRRLTANARRRAAGPCNQQPTSTRSPRFDRPLSALNVKDR